MTLVSREMWRVDAAFAGAIALAGAGLYFGGVRPAQERVARAAEQRETLATRLEEAKDIKKHEKESHDRLTALETKLAHSRVTLLSVDTGQNERLAGLSQLVAQASAAPDKDNDTPGAGPEKITILKLSPEPARSELNHQVVPIKLSGAGTYPALVSFLSSLHRTYTDVDVTEFTFSAPVDGPLSAPGAGSALTPGATGASGPGKTAAGAAVFEFQLVWYAKPEAKTEADEHAAKKGDHADASTPAAAAADDGGGH